MNQLDPRELLRREVAAAAQDKSVDPDAVALIAVTDGHVETDDKGGATNAAAAVEAVLANRPGLRTPMPNFGQGRSRDRQPRPSGIDQGYRLHEQWTANGHRSERNRIVGGHQEFL